MSSTNINIRQPELWTLQLALEQRSISYMLYTDAQENSLITGSIDLDNSVGDYLKSLENAVYDNPLLLDDYKQVRVLIGSQHFVIVPPECDDFDAQDLLEVTFPDCDGDVAVCDLKRCGVKLAFEVPKGVLAFLQRTFNTPPVFHHLHPLCEHYKRLNEGSEISRMFLNFSPNHMDMVVYRKGNIVLANGYDYRSAQDAAYFALHAWDSLNLDRLTDEVQLTGSKEERDAIAPILREYIGFVMPAIYPAAAMRIGQNAMKAPFDLIMLALCES